MGNRVRGRLNNLPLALGGDTLDKRLILWLILIIVVCYTSKIVLKKLNKSNEIHIKVIGNILIGVIILSLMYYISLEIPGLDKIVSNVLAISSLLVVAVSFASQEAVSNIISGLFISLYKPFEIGDRITIVSQNITGYVEDINLRHTTIRTFTNSRILVPNSIINKENIENSQIKDTKSSMWIDIYIGYNSDIQLAKEIMAEVISTHKLFIDTRKDDDIKNNKPIVNVLVRELGEYYINLRANVWTENIDDNFQACSDIREELVRRYKDAGIEIPYRRLDISLIGGNIN